MLGSREAVFFEDIMSVDDDDIQDSCDDEWIDYDCYWINNPEECDVAGGTWYYDSQYCECDY